jgi:hypothetical protein
LLIALVAQRIDILESGGKHTETIGGYSYTKAAIHAFEDGDLRAIPGAIRTLEYWRVPVLA